MAAWNSTIGAIHEQGDIEVYISFHAYAQKLLSSWAVDFSIIPNEPPTLAELQAAGAAATQDRIHRKQTFTFCGKQISHLIILQYWIYTEK